MGLDQLVLIHIFNTLNGWLTSKGNSALSFCTRFGFIRPLQLGAFAEFSSTSSHNLRAPTRCRLFVGKVGDILNGSHVAITLLGGCRRSQLEDETLWLYGLENEDRLAAARNLGYFSTCNTGEGQSHHSSR